MKKLMILFVCLMMCSCKAGGYNNTKVKENIRNVEIQKLYCGSARPHVTEKNIKKTTPESSKESNAYTPINYDVHKGMWLSYIDLQPMLAKDKSEFESKFNAACKNIKELGCNTVYVHLRPFGDALYNSKLYPKSYLVKGDYDPLEIMVSVAHSYKLSVHGWINPLRCTAADDFENIPNSYQTKQWYNNMDTEDKLRKVEGDEHLWLNPAYEEVRRLIADGAKEIAENYNVDGIHYDDYFYPTTDKSFDKDCYESSGKNKSLAEFRRDNISALAKEIYSSVKSVNKNISVGISPQGNIENNINNMYADVYLWGSEEGYADYLEPQIYFGYKNAVKPFLKTVEEWQNLVKNKNIKLVIGLGAYKIFNEEEYSQSEGIIARQISDSLKSSGGVGIYTYNSFFAPEDKFDDRISAEKEKCAKVLCEK